MQKGITIFRWKILSHSTEKFRRRTFLCCVSENFRYRKSLWIRGRGGGSQDFPSKIFCLTAPKNVRDKRGGGYHGFPSKLFWLTVPKKLRRGTLRCFRNFLVSKKFMLQRVMSRFSVENFLSHSTEKFCRGTLLCCVSENFWYLKSSWIRWGEYQDFPSKTVSQCRKFSKEPLSVSLVSGVEKC